MTEQPKTMWPINRLKNWDKNPRATTDKDFKRLIEQIERHGQYKPLIVNEEGIVLGGNMRLRAYRQMGTTLIWVSIVHAETEQEMLEYALSDNDQIGFYEKDALAELAMSAPEIDLSLYHVNMDTSQSLEEVLDEFTGSPTEEVEEQVRDKTKDIECPHCGETFRA